LDFPLAAWFGGGATVSQPSLCRLRPRPEPDIRNRSYHIIIILEITSLITTFNLHFFELGGLWKKGCPVHEQIVISEESAWINPNSINPPDQTDFYGRLTSGIAVSTSA
jgi:hypothetical protein